MEAPTGADAVRIAASGVPGSIKTASRASEENASGVNMAGLYRR